MQLYIDQVVVRTSICSCKRPSSRHSHLVLPTVIPVSRTIHLHVSMRGYNSLKMMHFALFTPWPALDRRKIGMATVTRSRTTAPSFVHLGEIQELESSGGGRPKNKKPKKKRRNKAHLALATVPHLRVIVVLLETVVHDQRLGRAAGSGLDGSCRRRRCRVGRRLWEGSGKGREAKDREHEDMHVSIEWVLVG